MVQVRSEARARSRMRYSHGIYNGPIDGPVYICDSKLYNAQNTALTTRSSVDITEDQWFIGPYSDTLDAPAEEYGTPISHWYPHSQQHLAEYDQIRDIWWLSKKLTLPYYVQGLGPTTRELLPPNTLTGERFTITFETISDVVTENFPHLRDRGVSVNNPALITKHGCDEPYTFWVKATLWNTEKNGFGLPVYTSIADTKYLRIDIIGLEIGLLSGLTNFSWFGYPQDLTGLSNASFELTTFAKYVSQLDEYRHFAMDKANRGVMDVLVTLAELPKTVKLVKELIPKLKRLKTIARVARSDTFYIERPPIDRHIAQKWLEGRYGWRQIVFDCQGLGRLVTAAIKRFRRSYTSGTARDASVYLSSDETQELYLGTAAFTVQHVGYGQLRAGVALQANLSNKWYKKLYELAGGFNPVALAWELTKLSWMLDWVIDVGSYLTAFLRDPARYAHAWYTLDIPYERGGAVFRGEISNRDMLADSVLSTSPSNGFLLTQLFGDDEDIYPLLGRSCKAKVYIRIPQDTSRYPLVLANGIGIRSGSQIADLLSVFLVLRK